MTTWSVTGRWRMTEMELWDREAKDLVGPAMIEFEANGTGVFRFIAVEASLDYRSSERDGRPAVEFTWARFDESDPASGRGWVILEDDGTLRGRIYFHLGDESAFSAVRFVGT